MFCSTSQNRKNGCSSIRRFLLRNLDLFSFTSKMLLQNLISTAQHLNLLRTFLAYKRCKFSGIVLPTRSLRFYTCPNPDLPPSILLLTSCHDNLMMWWKGLGVEHDWLLLTMLKLDPGYSA